MKKSTLFFTGAAILLSLLSCENFGEYLTVTFDDVKIEEVIDIPLNNTNPSIRSMSLVSDNETTGFMDSLILNMNSAAEEDSTERKLAQSLEDISSIDIDTLSVELLRSHNGVTLPENFMITTLTVTFSNKDSLIHSETHKDVIPGELIISPVTRAGLDGISTTLEQNNDLKIVVSGYAIGNNDITSFALKARIIADVQTTTTNVFSTIE